LPISLEHLLHALEGLGVDESLVGAGILDTAPGDIAHVVPVFQNLVQLVGWYGSGVAGAGWTPSQSTEFEFASSTRTGISYSPSQSVTLAQNAWTKVSASFTVTSAGGVQVGGYVPNYTAWTSTDYLDMDSVMLTSGTTSYNYADGNSTDWTWNGSPNSSTSTGPAL
jgi:hypothetical protein